MKKASISNTDGFIKSAHGELTGKPSMDALRQKVTAALEQDIRFDTEKHGYPEGSLEDRMNEPYCIDILVPDDDGKLEAVIHTDDGRTVRHGFTWDGSTVTMDDGDSVPTTITTVYARAIAHHDAMVRAESRKSATSQVVHCRASGVPIESESKPWEVGKEAEFQWMPGGISTITATYNGRPIELTVDAEESTADVVQASFDQWRSEQPKQKPLVCVEHREEEAAAWPERFEWRTDPEPGVFCTAVPSELGARHVTGRIHRSFSPSFTTDADYSACKCANCRKGVDACKCGGLLVFPDSVRGSRSNPARITGVGFSVGSLTNKPAFKNILPVRAKEGSVTMIGNYANGDLIMAGDFPGNPFRGNQYASGEGGGEHNAASGEAHERSKVAKTSGEHKRAAAAHKKAARLHEEEGNDQTAEYHRQMVSFHEKAAAKGGTAKAVGDYDNILLVRASEDSVTGRQAPQPEYNAGTKGHMMKVKLIKARENRMAGTVIELAATDAVQAIEAGDAIDLATAERIDASERRMAEVNNKIKAHNEARIKDAVVKAKARNAIAPKDTEVEAKALERLAHGTDADILVELIEASQGKDMADYQRRLAQPMGDQSARGKVELVRTDPVDAAKGIIAAREPMNALIRAGHMDQAIALSKEAAVIAHTDLFNILRAGGDFRVSDLVKAAGYDSADPNSQYGTLNTGLILMRNLGFLKNKLNWLPYLTTDLRAEPVAFGQNVLTRYLSPPDVLTWIPGVGYTSDQTTISNASATTTQAGITIQASGTRTPSVPSVTDQFVQMNQHKACELEFRLDLMAGTIRNLAAEQQSAQLYALAETVNKYVLGVLFGATWSGTVISKTVPLATWNLTGAIAIKNALTLSKVPDVGRFMLLHSSWYDALMTDSNLLSAKAILSLINKDQSSFESADLPAIFGLKPLESQLAIGTVGSTTLGSVSVDSTSGAVTFGANNCCGFAGNMSSALFVARLPQDYTALANALGVPATAAIEVVTEPDSGLSMLVVRYVDNVKGSVVVRCALMYGAHQGDPRVGIPLRLI